MPRLVILDGHTLNPGDLSWDPLKALGDCVIYDRTPAAEVVARAQGAELVLTNKTPVSAAAMEELPSLRYIGVLATGFNIVDAQAARSRGIAVSNVPAYGTASVAQMTFGLILELALQVGHHASTVRKGRWSQCPDFCYWDHPLVELHGQTLGIVGLGRIGAAVAKLGQAFGMKVIASSSKPDRPAQEGIEFVELDALFSGADVLSLHCPLTPGTQGLVNERRLALMKPTAFLINTSRGPLIDETALARALTEGRLAGAGLDVLSVEPPPGGNPLLTAPRCLVTPHIAWASRSARSRLMAVAVENARSFLAGCPVNVVNLS